MLVTVSGITTDVSLSQYAKVSSPMVVMPFGILMLWRLFNYAIIGAVEGVMIYYVTKNKAVSSLIAGINRRKTQ